MTRGSGCHTRWLRSRALCCIIWFPRNCKLRWVVFACNPDTYGRFKVVFRGMRFKWTLLSWPQLLLCVCVQSTTLDVTQGVLSLAWSLLSRLGWLTCEPQRSFCGLLLSTGITSVCHHSQFCFCFVLMWVLGIKLWVLVLATLNWLAISPCC